MSEKRAKYRMTVAEFLTRAIDHELPILLDQIAALQLPGPPADNWRPARLPLTDALLAKLKAASQTTGIPANRLLLAAITRGCGRKRRWKKQE
jgi:hypothetical protein